MILRHIERRPVKSLLTVLGIALAGGITMVGRFQEAAITHMVNVHYKLSQREDLAVTFVEPTSWRAISSLGSLPGVERVEVYRSVPVDCDSSNIPSHLAQGRSPQRRFAALAGRRSPPARAPLGRRVADRLFG